MPPRGFGPSRGVASEARGASARDLSRLTDGEVARLAARDRGLTIARRE